jgi:hypothetical protein
MSEYKCYDKNANYIGVAHFNHLNSVPTKDTIVVINGECYLVLRILRAEKDTALVVERSKLGDEILKKISSSKQRE